MKRVLFLLLSTLVSSISIAQMRWNQAYQQYIYQYKDLAIHEMLRYGIPASITLAQGLFESSAGRSELSVKGNNHFGIKCHGWEGRGIYHDDDEKGECFRAYDNVLQSYEDHSKFLHDNSRYASLFRLSRTDYQGWAYGLKACGYATNPPINLLRLSSCTNYMNTILQLVMISLWLSIILLISLHALVEHFILSIFTIRIIILTPVKAIHGRV